MGTTLLNQDLMGTPEPLIQGVLVFVSEHDEYTSPLQKGIKMENCKNVTKTAIL